MDAVVYGEVTTQIGKKADTASATGTLHAKVKNIGDKVVVLGTSSDTRGSNTVMGWLNSPIKSIQRGTITISGNNTTATATISSVNTSKAHVVFLGQRAGSSNANSALATLELTNSTTVTAARSGTDYSSIVSYEVIEFY